MPARIEATDTALHEALQNAIDVLDKPDKLLSEIGDRLIDSTKQRFATSTAPDGSHWLANARSTIEDFLNKNKTKNFGKRGKLIARGVRLAINKKPLIGESKALSSNIYKFLEGHTLIIGSTIKYAAVQQLGASKGQFGPHTPWGDIPARPYLGLSNDDIELACNIIADHLEGRRP